MSLLIVRTGNQAFYRQTTTLEGATYLLDFQYNQRCNCFYMSIADASGVDIYNGVKLVCNVGLLRKCADPRKPAGELFVRTATADASPPGKQDLLAGSGRCRLLYITSDWLALLRAGPSVAAGTAAIVAQVTSNTVNRTGSVYGKA